jgi:predicted phosphodiesterase
LSSTSTTPIILPEDIKFYLSGGYFNVDPSLSLGGEISSFQLVSGTLNGLFDRVDTSEAELGDIEYRCVYLRNTSQTRKLLGAKIWIETGTASADTSIAISIGSSGINGIEPTIPDEGIDPPMNFFEVPLQAPEEPNIGDLYPGDHIALWVRWYVKTGTTSIANDFAVIRIDGEREPESVSQPIPDPTDPPPSTEGCPSGSKWSPVEMRCVDDSTVIICPNGYTYNSTTQRCVPPTTPPPSLPDMRFAAVGDFTCGSGAEDVFALIDNKLTEPQNDVFLALGDFSYVDGDQSCWIDLAESLALPIENIAPIIGNHDDSEDGSASDRTDIINHFPLIPSSGYYAFTRRNIRFIMMDTQVSYGTSSAQYTFVKTELEAATANPAIKWKVVCYHKPSFTSATDYGPLTDLRSAYHPLFDTHKVDLIFSGHNHNYGRSKPVRYNASSPDSPIIASDLTTGNYINIDGRVFITAGTGGRSSHPEFDGAIENFMGFRHEPEPYGSIFVTLQDSGNQLHVQFITTSNQILDDFHLSKPGATPPPTGEAVCPQGFHFDSNLGRCIISPEQCPTNYRWEPTQNRCVAMSGEPGTPPGPVDPMAGVIWLYDATATLNTPQTINAGSYDSVAGIILSSGHGSITSTTISGGWLTLPGAGAATATASAYTHVGIDYWKLSQYATDDRLGKNTAVTFTFRYNGNTSISVRDGNSYRTGVLSPAMIFEGFACDFVGPNPTVNGILDCTSARVIYWYDPSVPTSFQSETIRAQYPGGRSLTEGQDYKVFITYKTNRVTNIVVTNAWLDFGDGDGWIKVITDQTYSASNWLPGSVPTGYDDTDEINSGPTAIRRHRISIVNWNTTIDYPRPSLMIKDIKVGITPYLSDVNNPPPGTGNPGGGGSGTGGVLDSRGIKWYYATGSQGVIAQTRNESTDDRWSGNVSGLGQYGYECTMIMQNFSGVASGGHFAMKHGGPNHSGDCAYSEDGACCCWYDTGIRSNGDVQFQIERPHPNNSSGNNPHNVPFFFSNIGKGMNGNSIGLKWVWHPVLPGGDADNGGIRLMMWVDTDPVGTDGKPKNGWRLAYDIVDNGSILGDYPPPDEHDLEIRNSDTSNRTVFGGGLHWRKIQANDTLQWGTGSTGGGGGGGTTNPPPTTTPPPTTGGTILWNSNTHGLWNNGVSRTVTDTEGNQGVNGKGIFTAASGNPTLSINGSGEGTLLCDADSHGRIYIKASNYNAILTVEFRFNHSSVLSTTTKLRSRHHIDEEDADCEDRFGGFGCHVSLEEQNAGFQIETCHNEHEPSVDFNLPVTMTTGKWYKYRFSLTNINNNTQVFQKLEMDFGDGLGWRLIGQDTHTNPLAHWMDEPSFNDSVIWLRNNTGGSSGSVSFRNVTLQQYGGTPTTPPPPVTPPGTGVVTYNSNTHGNWNNGVSRTVTTTEGSQAANGKGLFIVGSGSPRLEINGAGVARFYTTGEMNDRFYIKVTNYNSILEYDFMLHNANVRQQSAKLRSRHQESGACENRFGGLQTRIGMDETAAPYNTLSMQLELCHPDYRPRINYSLPVNLQLSQWYTVRFTVQDSADKTYIYSKTELNYNDGLGFRTVGETIYDDLDAYMINESLYAQESYIWLRMNTGTGTDNSVSYRNVKLTNTGTLQTTPPSSTFKILSWGDNDTTQDAEEVLNIIMTESSVEQYLFAGDGPYSNSGTAWVAMMASYFNTTALKNKLMLAQGNHEHPESASQQAENDIEAWFPGLHNATNEGLEWLQAKQVRNCYIIVMNSQDPNINTVGGAQYNWVQARLNDAIALRNAGQINWIITMVHKNWFSLTTFAVDAEDTRRVYQTMFNNAQVDFMFSGHTHTYQLFKPITTRASPTDETLMGTQLLGTLNGSGQWNFALPHGVIHIINGNGGHEINSFGGDDPAANTNILYANDTEFGYTVLEINGRTARVIAKSVGGNVRHTATIVR